MQRGGVFRVILQNVAERFLLTVQFYRNAVNIRGSVESAASPQNSRARRRRFKNGVPFVDERLIELVGEPVLMIQQDETTDFEIGILTQEPFHRVGMSGNGGRVLA